MTDPFASLLQPPPVPQAWPEEMTRRYTSERPGDAQKWDEWLHEQEQQEDGK